MQRFHRRIQSIMVFNQADLHRSSRANGRLLCVTYFMCWGTERAVAMATVISILPSTLVLSSNVETAGNNYRNASFGFIYLLADVLLCLTLYLIFFSLSIYRNIYIYICFWLFAFTCIPCCFAFVSL